MRHRPTPTPTPTARLSPGPSYRTMPAHEPTPSGLRHAFPIALLAFLHILFLFCF